MDGGDMQSLKKGGLPFALLSYISGDTGSFDGQENWRASVCSVHTLLGLKMPLLLQRNRYFRCGIESLHRHVGSRLVGHPLQVQDQSMTS